ncbi:beta-trefoil DNA-binding domain-containing protein [Gilbertella persicaria]|uniref:beta-trefoil DNA-binding domain-containing protein n=1 Tax=Gilbertella persicaria TaxID=101096 RepID=UPI0022207B59|nr:beta-trefoil DNA-binding domain-containing protein [Gilbertella persicaria]KAI8066254.1 beta-trefoil DNA-binding domain-containing protein [Gilbertella persicaria]
MNTETQHMHFIQPMTPMESLLSAIDNAKPIHLPQPNNKRSRPSSPQQSMSIESILDHHHERPFKRQNYHPVSPPPQSPPLTCKKMSTVTCYHASVAQKSYGSEKRFLCPPPIVMMSNQLSHTPLVSMTVVCETGDRQLEQRALLDENLKGSFKYLFVTGTAKAKQFCLRVNLTKQQQQQSYASFFSSPISIISKPSKKTAKARNISTCLFNNAYVSLFNRINSQTVRTKYLTTENKQMCAKHASWSPFEIIVVRQPNQALNPDNHSVSVPITYGTEIILKDVHTGISSPPLIIRKVDKGRIVNHAYGLLSQMQKIALQLASSSSQAEPLYLNANGQAMHHQESDNHSNHNTSAWIDFSPSKIVQEAETTEIVSDYLCWTIVGISKFEYSFSETNMPIETTQRQLSPPPSPPRSIMPYPLIHSVDYAPSSHALKITGQHLTHGRLLEFWLGSHGPLKAKEEAKDQVLIELPDTQNLTTELPLLLVRQDGFVYHSNKSLCYQSNQWSIMDTTF